MNNPETQGTLGAIHKPKTSKKKQNHNIVNCIDEQHGSHKKKLANPCAGAHEW